MSIIQQDLKGESTWEDIIRYGGAYSTSILIHEIVEIRALEARGLNPLKQRTRALRALLGQHVEAHVIALYEEHLYLQEVILRFYSQRFEVATLVKANRNDDTDLQLFLESEVGVYLLEEDRVEEARHVLVRLKGEEP